MCESNNYLPGKYVVTGGSGFGKTALIKEFDKVGLITIPETTLDYIKNFSKGDPSKLPWNNRPEFQKIIVNQRIKDYFFAPIDKPSFFDRGIPDEIAYYLGYGLKPSNKCLEASINLRYDQIFVLPPWEEIYVQDEFRPFTFEESIRIHHLVGEAYLKLGYSLIEVPRVGVEKRLNFVLNSISQKV
ncbi:AAA family ATPase [archaeon]|jgi:predicted ATPase|nr:AAA family ATPase [archaeon]MBT3451107.1 AAA family ATPase [archaeon]MBT6868649.1 AAA family ATPase [archaeon]MBT7193384.1 AAA family ATPase [archaeon]MBT7381446.1 AAA family ATPase [archaeon]